jgi:tetratricopeptide (TPR) repeat protein
MQLSRHDEAEQAGRTAIETLEPLGDSADLADALHRLGWFYWRRGRTPEADPLLRRAIDIAARVDAKLVRAEATQTLAVSLLAFGSLASSQRLMEEAFTLAKEAGDTNNLFRAYNNVATTRGAAQGPRAVVDVLTEGLELAMRAGIINNSGWIAGSLGDTLLVLGRLDEAERYQRQAVDLARRAADEPLEGQRLVALALAILLRGRVEEATEVRNESEPLLTANPEPQAAHFLPEFDGYVALARGDRAEAAEKFVEAASLARAHSIDAYPEVFTDCVRALVLTGDVVRAASFRDLDTSTDSVQSAAHARNVAGLLESDPAQAQELLRDAVAQFERLEMRIYAARAMVDLGRAMAQTGDDPAEILERARDIITACDAQLFLSEVDEALVAPRLA